MFRCGGVGGKRARVLAQTALGRFFLPYGMGYPPQGAGIATSAAGQASSGRRRCEHCHWREASTTGRRHRHQISRASQLRAAQVRALPAARGNRYGAQAPPPAQQGRSAQGGAGVSIATGAGHPPRGAGTATSAGHPPQSITAGKPDHGAAQAASIARPS